MEIERNQRCPAEDAPDRSSLQGEEDDTVDDVDAQCGEHSPMMQGMMGHRELG